MSLIVGESPPDYAPSLERRQLVPWLTASDLEALDDPELHPDLMLDVPEVPEL